MLKLARRLLARLREWMEAAWLDEIEQRVKLPAAWTGWRMQGGVLVPKHRRFQIRPETAERFGEWAKNGLAGGA